jgi:hypothetical protein
LTEIYDLLLEKRVYLTPQGLNYNKQHRNRTAARHFTSLSTKNMIHE